MQGAFAPVLVVVCVIALVLAIVALATSGKVWEEHGKGGLVLDRDLPRGPAPGSPADLQERDEEIRAMLEARNARRARRGEEPLDVEREIARLTGPRVDPALREEIRVLVVARNRRRVRAGRPPLDVDAEVEREIERLGDLG